MIFQIRFLSYWIWLEIVLFIIGLLITWLYVRKKEWFKSFKPVAILNFVWFIICLIVDLILLFTIGNLSMIIYRLFYSIIPLVINIIIGTLLAMKLFDIDLKQSAIFVIIILVILFILMYFITPMFTIYG